MQSKIRIAKYIANAGYCSRRDAEKLIEDLSYLTSGGGSFVFMFRTFRIFAAYFRMNSEPAQVAVQAVSKTPTKVAKIENKIPKVTFLIE